MQEIYLKSLNRKVNYPLWNNDLEWDDLKLIQETLYNAYLDSNLKNYCEEAAFMFAEWWKNHYSGEAPSIADVTSFSDLPEEAEKELYSAAKRFLTKYNIPLIRQQYTLYFRTLLYQGGLPINFIINNDNNYSSYVNFLQELCYEISDKIIDWDDVSIFDHLGCKDSLSPSFRTDEIYGLSLRLIRAIIQDREDLLPYNDLTSDKFRRLTARIRESIRNAQNRRTFKPLSLKWELRIKAGVGNLYYHLDNIKHISTEITELPEECRQFSIHLGDRRVATYQKGKENYYRITSETVNCKWSGEAFIDVNAIISYNESQSLNVVDNCPPDFSFPIVFKKDGNNYVQKGGDSSEGKIVVYRKGEWTCSDQSSEIDFSLDGQELCYIPFTDNIILTNSETGEEQEYTNTYSPFSIEYTTDGVPWLDSANFRIITGRPKVRVYDEEGNMVESNRYSLTFSQKRSGDWKALRNTTILPKGLVYIKTTLPDRQVKIDSFYNVADLSFDIVNRSQDITGISVDPSWGRVEILEQEGLTITKDSTNTWTISKSPGLTNYSHIISFEAYTIGSPSVRINLPTPFTSFCIKRISTNEVVRRTEIISSMNLSDYIIVERGHNNPKVILTYPSTDRDICSSLTINIRNRITPLSDLREAIESIFNLYGHKAIDMTRALSLRIEGTEYKVRRFSLGTELDEGNIHIYNNRSEEYSGQILCCSFDPASSSSYPVVEPLECVANNRYQLPPDSETNSIIVFSDKYDTDRIIPKTYGASQVPVREWEPILTEENLTNSPIWEKVNKLFELCVEYNLPFRTFNELNAISSRPYLLAKLVISLFFEGKDGCLLAGLGRFESELGIALQWIRFQQWTEALNDFSILPQRVQDRQSGEFFEFFRTLLATSRAENFEAAILNPNTAIPCISNEVLQNIRQYTSILINQNGRLPEYPIQLQGRYYRGVLPRIQETFINGILYILEYLTGKDDSLWEHAEETKRRVINFYRNEFGNIFTYTTEKILK